MLYISELQLDSKEHMFRNFQEFEKNKNIYFLSNYPIYIIQTNKEHTI